MLRNAAQIDAARDHGLEPESLLPVRVLPDRVNRTSITAHQIYKRFQRSCEYFL